MFVFTSFIDTEGLKGVLKTQMPVPNKDLEIHVFVQYCLLWSLTSGDYSAERGHMHHFRLHTNTVAWCYKCSTSMSFGTKYWKSADTINEFFEFP